MFVDDCLAPQLTFHLVHNTPLVGEVPGTFPLSGEGAWGGPPATLWRGCACIGAIKSGDQRLPRTHLIYSKDVSLTAISISKCSHLLRSMHKILALTAAQASAAQGAPRGLWLTATDV